MGRASGRVVTSLSIRSNCYIMTHLPSASNARETRLLQMSFIPSPWATPARDAERRCLARATCKASWNHTVNHCQSSIHWHLPIRDLILITRIQKCGRSLKAAPLLQGGTKILNCIPDMNDLSAGRASSPLSQQATFNISDCLAIWFGLAQLSSLPEPIPESASPSSLSTNFSLSSQAFCMCPESSSSCACVSTR